MNPAPRVASAALVALGCCLAPDGAHAQLRDRLAVHVEGGVSVLLSSPYSDDHGVGGGFGVRPSIRVGGPVWVHLSAAYARWSDGANGPAALWTLGGGVTVAPVISQGAGRLLVQAEVGYGLTGASAEGRVALGGALGWLFPLGRGPLELGPVVRVGAALDDGTPGATVAVVGSGGITLGIRAPLSRLARSDRDRDGVDDASDACPDEPAGSRPDEARRGCPVFDRDGDEVPDAQDQCADEAAGPRPDPSRAGCPAVDRDGDRINDDRDRCPNEREDLDNFEDDDGCPESDNDRDGVPDAQDACPNAAETRNGVEDDDGCPDSPPVIVPVEGGAPALREPPRFEQGSAELSSASIPALEAYAAALAARDDLRRITVICHAEAPGDRGAVRLARRRAQALASWLRAHGVSRRARARGVAASPAGDVRIEVELRRSAGPRAHRRRRR